MDRPFVVVVVGACSAVFFIFFTLRLLRFRSGHRLRRLPVVVNRLDVRLDGVQVEQVRARIEVHLVSGAVLVCPVASPLNLPARQEHHEADKEHHHRAGQRSRRGDED
jgi:hypothetical protein